MKITSRQSQARKVLTASLGPSVGMESWKELERWIESNGTEWAVKRLKALFTAAKQLRAGQLETVKQIYQESSIAYNHTTLIVKGPWKHAMQRYIYAQNPVAIRRVCAAFRVYTALVLESVSKHQVAKVLRSIQDPSTGQEVRRWKRAVAPDQSALWLAVKELKLESKLHLPVPDLGRLKALSSYHREVKVAGFPTQEAWGKAVISLMSSCYLPLALQEMNPLERLRQDLISCGVEHDTPGHLSTIQEGGCKGRVVAVPNLWSQWLFEPLHRGLDAIVKTLPGSAVHNQNSGGWYLQSHLSQGVHCFDLSSATDRFPRQWQHTVLLALGLDQYAEALEEISNASWVYPDGGCSVSYAVGQPMGLYGSFPLFHLTHWLLLYHCTRRSNGGKPDLTKLPFQVLGDDVIITDDEVAGFYKEALTLAGVECSPTKSISSKLVGEFAGFLCHKTRKGYATFRPYKHPTGQFITAPVNLIYSLGWQVRHYGPYWVKMFRLFSQTQLQRELDLSPLVGDDQGERRNPPTLDTHLWGSLANRYAMMAPIGSSYPDSMLDNWERDQVTLLGNRERLSADGTFAPKNLQLDGIRAPESREEETPDLAQRIAADPLLKALRYARM